MVRDDKNMFCSGFEKTSVGFIITSNIVVATCITIDNITEKFCNQGNLAKYCFELAR